MSGCARARDDLRHYLECPILLALVSEQIHIPLGPTVFHRLNVFDPNKCSAVALTLMYNMYHTLKVGHRQTVNEAVAIGRFGRCCQIATAVASDYSRQYSHILSAPIVPSGPEPMNAIISPRICMHPNTHDNIAETANSAHLRRPALQHTG